MNHHRYRKEYIGGDNCENTLDFPCTGFWLAHILGGIFIFFLGMRFALKRTPLLPIIIFRLLRGSTYR